MEITLERRTKLDFAHQMRWLVVEAYPEAEVIRVAWTIWEHPSQGAVVRDGVPGGGGPAHCAEAGVSPHRPSMAAG